MAKKSDIILKADMEIQRCENGNLAAGRKRVLLKLKPIEGEHIFLAEPQDLGSLADEKRIHAVVSICYDYMPKEKSIILCGGGYSGIKRNEVILKDQETQREIGVCRNESFDEKSCNQAGSLGQNLMESVRDMLNVVSDQLVKSAEEQGLNVYIRKDLFRTEEEKKAFQDLGFVYKDGMLEGFYNPEKEYGAEYKIVPLTSTSGGVVDVNVNTNFYNVIGSTGDHPNVGGSWIGFWANVTGRQAISCTADTAGFCNDQIIGGHIVFWANQQQPLWGSNQIVAILPICSRHNANPNMTMTAQVNTQAVWLNNYHF